MTEKISAAQAKERLGGFGDYINETLAAWDAPGAAVAVVADGEVIHSAGYGLRDMEQRLPVTPETLFAIGSCTKAFTAFGLGLLVDEGKLVWNTPIQQKLPQFRLHDPVASVNANVKDLLMHRTGLPRHDFAWYGSALRREQLIDRLWAFQPSLGFREAFQYNNLMFMTAGALAARVAGMDSWEALTQALILEPLGMHNANFSVHGSETADNAAQPYLRINDRYQRVPFRNLDHIGPAGSINANLIDMAPWLLMHLNGGLHNGRPLIHPETLREMHTPQIVMPIPPESPWHTYPVVAQPSYGLGWAGQTYRGRTMIRHNGGIDGFIAIVSFLPNEGVGTIILTNSGSDFPATAIHCHLYDRLLGTERPAWNERFKDHAARLKAAGEKAKSEMLSKQIPGTRPSHPLSAYEGVFTHPGYGDLSITRDGDLLRFAYNGLELEGVHHHYDVFRIANEALEILAPCTFVTDLSGEISSVQVPLEPSVAPVIFTRKTASGA